MKGRLKSISDSVKEVKKVENGKEYKLEKGDFRALCSAAWQTMGKTVLLVLLFFAVLIFVIVSIWNH